MQKIVRGDEERINKINKAMHIAAINNTIADS